MVEPLVRREIHDGAAGAGFRVGRAEHEPRDARPEHRSRAHRARLDCDIERRIGQPLALQRIRCLRDCENFGMRRRVAQAPRLIMRLPEQAPISGDKSRFITAALQLMFMQRGMEVGDGKKPVVMSFYAPWAQSCQELEPVMDRDKTEYGVRINFVTINVDDPNNEKVIDQYGVSPVPTLIFIDPKGEVVSYAIGFSGENSVETGIKKIL